MQTGLEKSALAAVPGIVKTEGVAGLYSGFGEEGFFWVGGRGEAFPLSCLGPRMENSSLDLVRRWLWLQPHIHRPPVAAYLAAFLCLLNCLLDLSGLLIDFGVFRFP